MWQGQLVAHKNPGLPPKKLSVEDSHPAWEGTVGLIPTYGIGVEISWVTSEPALCVCLFCF